MASLSGTGVMDDTIALKLNDYAKLYHEYTLQVLTACIANVITGEYHLMDRDANNSTDC